MSDWSVFAALSITVIEIVPGFRTVFKCTIPDSGKVNLLSLLAYKLLCIVCIVSSLTITSVKLFFFARRNHR